MLLREKIILIVIVLLTVLLYGTEMLLIVQLIREKLRKSYRKSIFFKIPAMIVHILSVAGIICFLYGWFIEANNIEICYVPIQTEKLKQTSFRIVQISDLHCNAKSRIEKTVVEMVNNLEPDVIIFTGDAINTPAALGLFKQTMTALEAPLGKFAIYGNWEARHWAELDYYSTTGFKILDSEKVDILKDNDVITISGVNYDKGPSAWTTFQNLEKDNFNVFCFHSLNLIEYIDNCNIDLYLCGHTHGGQVCVPFYGALVTMSKYGRKYVSGKHQLGETILYINRGIGMERLPAPQVRFLARPEITVFDIGPIQ